MNGHCFRGHLDATDRTVYLDELAKKENVDTRAHVAFLAMQLKERPVHQVHPEKRDRPAWLACPVCPD